MIQRELNNNSNVFDKLDSKSVGSILPSQETVSNFAKQKIIQIYIISLKLKYQNNQYKKISK